MAIKQKPLILIIFLIAGISFAEAQEYVVTRDLQREWTVFKNDAYEPFQKEGSARSIFFNIETAAVRNDYLYIESFTPYTIFINGKLAESSEGPLRLKIDSLNGIFQGSVWQVSVYQRKIKAGS